MKDLFKGLPLLLILGYFGCVDPVALDFHDDPRLVVISNFDPETPFKVLISRSNLLFSKDTLAIVENANVSLFRDGSHLTDLIYQPERGLYESVKQLMPEIGKTYRIEVEAPAFDPVQATNVIPEPVPIQAIRINNLETGLNGNGMFGYSYEAEITLQDPLDQENFYHLALTPLAFDFIELFGDTIIVPFVEPLFSTVVQLDAVQPLINHPERGFLAKDDLFRGTSKSFPFEIGFEIDPDRRVVVQLIVELYTVSPEYYRYYSAIARQNQSSDHNNVGAFDDPIPVYTNIENGFGIFAGFSSSVEVINIK